MRLEQINVWREEQDGHGPRGEMRLGDVRALLPGLIEDYAGQVQVIYLDPPFRTGQTFVMRVRVATSSMGRTPGPKSPRCSLTPSARYIRCAPAV